MALEAVHVSDVPNLYQVPENAILDPYASRFPNGSRIAKAVFKAPKMVVIGHRGNGMNILNSPDRRMNNLRENTILSFNSAAKFPIPYVEFDVQVTRDGYPIIFHDNFILSEQNGMVYEKRVTELSLSEFLEYGPQKETGKAGKSLLRKTKDGRILSWSVEKDDFLCTLKEAFEKVGPSLGFNIELKFDDHIVYEEEHLVRVLESILKVVFEHAHERPILFSSFQPDVALIVKKLQGNYPVFFLTNGGTELYYDARRNSLEAAIQLCLEGGLEGIVSEVKAIFRNPGAVNKIKESELSLLTYGKLNNVPEAVYMQHLMGVEGVIVDLVEEITGAVWDLMKPSEEEEEGGKEMILEGESQQVVSTSKPQFSQKELSFLLKLIPELIQH